MTNELHAPSLAERLELARAAPRCRARSRRSGKPCNAPAMPNGALPHAWRNEYRPSHTSGVGAQPESQLETRLVFCGAISDRRKAATAIRLLRRLVAGAA